MRKRLGAALLCLIIILALAPGAQGAWYDTAVEALQALDILPPQLLADYDASIRRDEFCAIVVSLYNWAVDAQGAFIDRGSFYDTTESPYYDSIQAAYNMGIVSGVSQSAFSPQSPITREQLAHMVRNFYRAYEGLPQSVTGKVYQDAADISAWAADSVALCADKGIMTGVSEDTFAPKASVTRAQALAVAYNIARTLTPPVYSGVSATAFPVIVVDGHAYSIEDREQTYYIQRVQLATGRVTESPVGAVGAVARDFRLLHAEDVIVAFDSSEHFITIDIESLEVVARKDSDLYGFSFSGNQAVYCGGWMYFFTTYKQQYFLCKARPDYTGMAVIRQIEVPGSLTLQSARGALYLHALETQGASGFYRLGHDGGGLNALYSCPDADERVLGAVFTGEGYAITLGVPNRGITETRKNGKETVSFVTAVEDTPRVLCYDWEGALLAEYKNNRADLYYNGNLYCLRQNYAACFTDKRARALVMPQLGRYDTCTYLVQGDSLALYYGGFSGFRWKTVIDLTARTMTQMNALDYREVMFPQMPYGALGALAYYDVGLLGSEDMQKRYDEMMAGAQTLYAQCARPGMSELELEQAFHDIIILNCQYDMNAYDRFMAGSSTTADDDAHNPYGVLIRRRAVCDGYAQTFSMLLDMAGIENYRLSGTVDGYGHQWNVVGIEGQYYHTDVTYDDPIPDQGNRVFSRYFNMSSSRMSAERQWITPPSYVGIYR